MKHHGPGELFVNGVRFGTMRSFTVRTIDEPRPCPVCGSIPVVRRRGFLFFAYWSVQCSADGEALIFHVLEAVAGSERAAINLWNEGTWRAYEAAALAWRLAHSAMGGVEV